MPYVKSLPQAFNAIAEQQAAHTAIQRQTQRINTIIENNIDAFNPDSVLNARVDYVEWLESRVDSLSEELDNIEHELREERRVTNTMLLVIMVGVLVWGFNVFAGVIHA